MFTMTHKQALSHPIRTTPPPDCNGKLEYCGSAFRYDVGWSFYVCQNCGKKVATVGGSVHWWNYEVEEGPADDTDDDPGQHFMDGGRYGYDYGPYAEGVDEPYEPEQPWDSQAESFEDRAPSP